MKTKIDSIWYSFMAVWIVSFGLLSVAHYALFHSILVSSLWKQPLVFWEFYIPRILCSLGIALLVLVSKKGAFNYSLKEWISNTVFFFSIILQCFLFNRIVLLEWTFTYASIILKLSVASFLTAWVCLMKKFYWQIIISLLIDIWIVAEMMYYRANGFFLDGPTMLMVDNMDGWWSSLKILVNKADLWLALPTIIVIINAILIPTKKRARELCICMLSIAFILNLIGCMVLQHNKYDDLIAGKEKIEGGAIELNPFSEQAPIMLGIDKMDYIRELSIIHAFIYNVRELPMYFRDTKVEYTDDEIRIINELFAKENLCMFEPQTHLIICLIESLEDWVITPEIMPNLHGFIQDHDNILYANSVETQVRIGTSADGQMIVNTGLLPIKRGAVCFRYSHNEFPSLSELYQTTCGIFPHSLSVWNQSQMSKAYHIDSNYVVSHSDYVIFQNVVQKADSFDYVLAITSSTHNPFETICDSSELDLDYKMPDVMARYIKSFNYFDKGLGILLGAIDSNPRLQNATIVITADHKIFQEDLRTKFIDYCESEGVELTVNRPYVPLIIYSPNISEKQIITKNCYQMDIYPTILDAIGCEERALNSFGVSLMRTPLQEEKDAFCRRISAYQASELSDKMIRDNYFKKIGR